MAGTQSITTQNEEHSEAAYLCREASQAGGDVGGAVVEEGWRCDGDLGLFLAGDDICEAENGVLDGHEEVSDGLVRTLQQAG